MKLNKVIHAFDEVLHPELAQDWDNVGLLIGNPNQNISRVLLCIDLTPAVLREAQSLRVNLVLAYHPPIFEPVKRVRSDTQEVIFQSVRSNIAVYSIHTAFDVIPGGTTDTLAEIIDLEDRNPIDKDASPGCIGEFRRPITLESLVRKIKKRTGLKSLQTADSGRKKLVRAAVCPGSCGKIINDLAGRADLFVTGEVRHHSALFAVKHGMSIICLGHGNSERPALDKLRKLLDEQFAKLEFLVSARDCDPLEIV